MKHLLSLLLLLCLSTSVAVAVPGYDPNLKTRHYDMSANMALKDKLKADFDKKYKINETTYAYPINAYNLEVTTPYYQKVDNSYHYVD